MLDYTDNVIKLVDNNGFLGIQMLFFVGSLV